jgi:hypothetical protein
MKTPNEIEMSLPRRSIILFTNIDVSRHILVIYTSVLVKSNMGRKSTVTLEILLLKLTGFVVEDRRVADSRPGVTEWSSPMRHMSPQK